MTLCEPLVCSRARPEPEQSPARQAGLQQLWDPGLLDAQLHHAEQQTQAASLLQPPGVQHQGPVLASLRRLHWKGPADVHLESGSETYTWWVIAWKADPCRHWRACLFPETNTAWSLLPLAYKQHAAFLTEFTSEGKFCVESDTPVHVLASVVMRLT